MKKTISVLLLLTMLVSLFAGLTLTAEAAQPTSASAVQYRTSGSYVYNWGKRDTVATFLTTYAQNYYTGQYSYATLSAKSGNSGTGTAFVSSELGTAIHNMLAAKQSYQTSYDGTRNLYQYTDCEENGNKISSFYSGTLIGPDWDSGSTWNREHIWPQSKSLGGSSNSDLMMLRPTSVSENSSRGNNAFGTGSGYYDPDKLGNNLRGDVARITLQHLMRWGDSSDTYYGTGGLMESRAILLQWMEEDPVDTWEMGRNDACQSILGVRNVFVDYPELAFKLLGASVPANYPTPSQSGGTVVPAQEYTVTFNVPNGVTKPASVTASRVTLPTPSGTPTGDYTYTFKGWVEASVDNETAKPANIHEAGEQLALSKDTTLYALYSYTAGGTGGSSTTFNKITTEGELADGASYVFVSTATGKALSQDVRSDWAYPGGTYNGNTIEAPTATDVWTVSGGVIGCANGNLYSSAAKKISLSSSTTNWTFTVSGGAWTIAAGNNVLSFNTTGWRPYSGGYGSDKTFYIYKSGVGGGTTYYTTVIGTQCNHTYTTAVTAPTCTAGGYTTYTCSKCGDTYTGNNTAALGHNYGSFSSNNNGTHSKTCSRCSDKVTESCSYTSSVSGATTTFTCSVCHYSYQTTAQTFTVRYNVLGTVSATASCVEGQSVTLPATATTVDGYTFAGWVKSTVTPETTTAPTILTGSYKPTANITLYALYSRTEAGGSTTPTLTKMVAGNTIADGDKLVIVAHDNDNVALYAETTGSSYVKKYTFDNKVASVLADSKNYLTVNAATGGYKLGDSTVGYLYTSGNNNLAMSTENNTVWTLSDLGDGTFNLVAANGRKLSYRYDLSTNPYWRMGGSEGKNGQTVLDLYKVTSGASSTTYYTTNPTSVTPPHVHDYDASGVCDCGDKLISIDSAALKLDEDIDVIYNATVPEGATASMTFTMNGESVTVEDDGTHTFIFEGVTPQCMGDNISATLNVTYGGKNYTCTKATYSVKTYCTDMLSKSSTTTQLRKLLSDTLAYGAAAQTYMSYKTNALVTSGVTGTSYSTFTALSGLAPAFTGTAADSPCWIGAGLTLTDDVAMVFRFASPNKTGLSVKVTYNGKTTTFSGTSITAVSGMSGVYEVKLTGIKATDFGQTVTAKFYKSSTQIGNTLGYSVNTYICAKQNDSNTALKNLVRALYSYGASAASYAN